MAPATSSLLALAAASLLCLPAARAGGLQRSSVDLGRPAFIAAAKPSSLHLPVSPAASRLTNAALNMAKTAATKPSAFRAPPAATVNVQRDFAEIDQLRDLLNQILAALALQDTADNALLASKEANRTAAVTSSSTANATVASAYTTLAATQSTLAVARAEVTNAEASADHSTALGLAEISIVEVMEAKLVELQAVGETQDPGSLLQIHSLASQLSHKGVLHGGPTALVGRPYPDQAAAVSQGIQALRAKIAEHNAVATALLAEKTGAKNVALASVTAASEAKVVAEALRDNAISNTLAAASDLEETRTLVTNSLAATQALRDTVAQISTNLDTLAGTNGLVNLQVGAKRFDDAKMEITFLLAGMEAKLDAEQYAETQDKIDKFGVYSAAMSAKAGIEAAYTAKEASLTAVDTAISVALTEVNAAEAALTTEEQAQAVEDAALTQVETIVSSLGADVALSPATMNSLQVGAQRTYDTLQTSINGVVSTLRADMLTTKNAFIATRDTKVGNHNDVVATRPAAQVARDVAYQAKTQAAADRAAKVAIYNTASAKLDNNNAVRTTERSILNQLHTLLSSVA